MTPSALILKRWFASCVAVAFLMAADWSLAQTPEVVDLPTRPGVTQRMLLLTPTTPVQAAVVLLVGGHGGLQIASNGSVTWGEGNFLARTRQQFADSGLLVALVDAPSDRQTAPYLNGLRQTAEHVQDLQAVIAYLRQLASRPVVLIGTSRGTQSAAWAALQLRTADAAKRPDGLVLTATILTDPHSRAVPEMPLEQLTLPVLISHHEQDACRHCRFSGIPAMAARIKAPLKVLSYQGGHDVGDPCGARAYHGFNGIETRVVADIATWIQEAVR